MNRRTASTFDSDDSESDWDTTVADSPSRNDPFKFSTPAVASSAVNHVKPEETYSTIVAKPRTSLNGSGDNIVVNGNSPANTPRHGIEGSNINTGAANSMASPPPHLTSFKNALTQDVPETTEPSPALPPRRYEVGKSQLYTVPETDLLPQTDVANWDDSDADERVLKEIQQNLGKEKQRQQQLQQQKQQQQEKQHQQQPSQQPKQEQAPEAKSRERKVTLATPGDKAQGQSPKVSRSDQWKQKPNKNSTPEIKGDGKQIQAITQADSHPYEESQHVIQKFQSRERGKSPPVVLRDSNGKRYVFYFEEGSRHYVEVEDDDVDAFLPEKIEEVERLFRRVWREVFAVFRIITSFFVLFLSELLRFLLHSVVRTILIDTLLAVGDHMLKPLLTVLFNAVLQPLLALLWNVCNATFHALDPLARLSGVLLSQVTMVVGAFRLFVINNPPANYNRDVNVV